MTTNADTRSLKVWDLPTRLFHWSLLTMIVACWWTSTANSDMDTHMRCGYAVLALLLFRLVWGVLGSTTARFSSFVTTPRAVLHYFASLRNKEDTPHIGHNPAGGWMVLALLLMLLLITGSGLFANDDMMTEGPLVHYIGKHASDAATSLHVQGFYLLLAMVALHVGAILFYLVLKKENLIRPMLTGNRHLPPAAEIPALKIQNGWLALLILGMTSGAVCLLALFA